MGIAPAVLRDDQAVLGIRHGIRDLDPVFVNDVGGFLFFVDANQKLFHTFLIPVTGGEAFI